MIGEKSFLEIPKKRCGTAIIPQELHVSTKIGLCRTPITVFSQLHLMKIQPDAFAKYMHSETTTTTAAHDCSICFRKRTLTYEDFKRIKYDYSLPTPLNYNYVDFNAILR